MSSKRNFLLINTQVFPKLQVVIADSFMDERTIYHMLLLNAQQLGVIH